MGPTEDGSAEPAIIGDDLDVVPVKKPPQVNDVPTMEKGDEPLSRHSEEVEEVAEKAHDEQGLLLFHKLGLVTVIVALCAVFVRGRGGAKVTAAGRHGAYEKSFA